MATYQNAKNLNCPECGRWQGTAMAGSSVKSKCKNSDCRAEVRFEVTEAGVNCIIVVPGKPRKPRNEDKPLDTTVNKLENESRRAGPKETK